MKANFFTGLRDQFNRIFFAPSVKREFQMDSLDGVRGLAVLGVLLEHAKAYGWHMLPGLDFGETGKPGVFLFFCLSAFLLTLPIYECATEKLRAAGYWVTYWMRRFLRIYPLFFCVLVVLFLLQPLIEHEPVKNAFGAIGRHLLLLEGFRHLWTVSVETKFYFVLPFIALGLRALRGKPLWQAGATLLAIIAAKLVFPREVPKNSINTGYYLPVFLLGCLAAVLFSEWRRKRPTGLPPVMCESLSAFTLLIALLLTQPALTGRLLPGFELNQQFILWGVLWAVFVPCHLLGIGWCRRLFIGKPIRFLGMVSYSAYIWHPIILQMMKKLKFLPSPVGFGLFLVVTILVSIGSYLLIERPLAGFRWKKEARPVSTGTQLATSGQ